MRRHCQRMVRCVCLYNASHTDRVDVTFQSLSEYENMCFGLICDLKWGNRICVSALANTQSKQ